MPIGTLTDQFVPPMTDQFVPPMSLAEQQRFDRILEKEK
jgi:hypothetical protein